MACCYTTNSQWWRLAGLKGPSRSMCSACCAVTRPHLCSTNGLVHHDPSVGQARPLPRFPCCQQEGRHAGCLAHTQCADGAAHVLHSTECKSGCWQERSTAQRSPRRYAHQLQSSQSSNLQNYTSLQQYPAAVCYCCCHILTAGDDRRLERPAVQCIRVLLASICNMLIYGHSSSTAVLLLK